MPAYGASIYFTEISRFCEWGNVLMFFFLCIFEWHGCNLRNWSRGRGFLRSILLSRGLHPWFLITHSMKYIQRYKDPTYDIWALVNRSSLSLMWFYIYFSFILRFDWLIYFFPPPCLTRYFYLRFFCCVVSGLSKIKIHYNIISLKKTSHDSHPNWFIFFLYHICYGIKSEDIFCQLLEK